MTASSLWPHAVEEFCGVKIPASEGPVSEVGHYIAPSCIMDEHLWSSGGSSNPLVRMPFPPFDLNKKDNTCARHVVPTTVQGWSTLCHTLSGTYMLMCTMDCTILVESKVLKASTQIWDSNRLLSVSCYLQTHITAHRDSLYMLSCCLCFFLYSFVCLASHLIFILPLWHIPLNVFNLAAFPNQSHTPLADSSAGFLLLILPLSLPPYPSLDARPCTVSVCRARHCEQTLLVSKERSRLMHNKHQPCNPGMHNTKGWCLDFGFNTIVSSRTVQ